MTEHLAAWLIGGIIGWFGLAVFRHFFPIEPDYRIRPRNSDRWGSR